MKKILLIALTALFCQAAMAQMRVTGTVTEEDGTAVSFATVVVKGNNSLITSTDIDGRFVLSNVPGNAVLVISSIGFITQEVPVNNRSVVNAVLSPDALALEEVMVVAYGTVRRSTYTGSAAMVTSEKIKDVPVTSFENALMGKVAGMQITTNSGQAGSSTNVRIRGIGSMSASNEPLYVIDGVPVVSGNPSQLGGYIYTTNNVMSSINPNDIESITVLKDAAASSLYGSRAANGVIMVTTKGGKVGKAKVTFRSSVSLTPSFATKNWEMATPEQIFEMYYELFWNGWKDDGRTDLAAATEATRQMNNRFNRHGYEFSTTDNTPKTLTVKPIAEVTSSHLSMSGFLGKPKEYRGDAQGNPVYFDWEKELLKTGIYQTYDLSVSGGTENTTVYSSIGYTKDKGRTALNEFSRISGRLNVTQKVGKVMELATIVGLSSTSQIGHNDSRNLQTNYFYLTRNMLWPLYWPTNFTNGEPWTLGYGSSARNPVYYDDTWENTSKTYRVSASEALTIKFMPSLSLRSILSYDFSAVQDHLYYSALHWNHAATNGNTREMWTNISKLVSSTTLNYIESFADRHHVNVLLGFEAERNSSDFLHGNGTQLPTSTLTTLSTAGSTTASGFTYGNTLVSMFSKLDYNYDLKYFLSGSFRRDGSSRFGADNMWGNFWSVSGAWSIHKEGFMAGLSHVVDQLRVRAAYGVNGTTPTSDYGWRSLTNYGSRYNEQPGGGLANIGNNKLTWETSYSTNIGIDFGLMNNRLRGTIEYFNRDSKNLLQNVPVSRVTGFTSTLQNVGEINNNGLEIEIGGDIIRSKDWNWDLSLSASFIESKITKLYGGQDIVVTRGPDGEVRTILREGEHYLSLWGREWAGVDQTNGQNVWYTNNEKNDPNIKGFTGGNVSYNYLDADDKILGSLSPKVYGGLISNVSWKNVSLGLNFMYKIGGYVYDQMMRDVNDDGYYWERIMCADAYDGRWTFDKGHGRWPKRTDKDLMDGMQRSSRHQNSATFLRLKNVTLSYSLPQTVVQKVGVSNARVYFNGSNLFTWAAYDLYDPEVPWYGGRGWELPIGKTYTFGLEFSF
ncbi:MAG: TonB-dependent receptor [Bacteroidales bacterium]|nr:TonB-dependent receptor [Bacteroidales bacterium]